METRTQSWAKPIELIEELERRSFEGKRPARPSIPSFSPVI